jgi:hypothetical protein
MGETVASIQNPSSGQRRGARYRGPNGWERARHLTRKVDGQRWLDDQRYRWSSGSMWTRRRVKSRLLATSSSGQNGGVVSNTDRTVRLGGLRRSHVDAGILAMQT